MKSENRTDTKNTRGERLLECLRASVRQDFAGFSLCYQPLMSAQNGALRGCEALLRWCHPDFPQAVSPCEFVPILEESGLILEVGSWVLDSAVRQCAVWGKQQPNFQMNINVSSVQFESPNFKFFVVELLAKYGVSPAMITLELTESGQIQDPAEMRRVFDFIRGQGIQIAFDDFGLGYASLSIFRMLSADELKIDRSFLDRISYDVTDQKIVTQLINLCHSMNMVVCVEGIETQEMESIVNQLEPDLLQGFYYNQPMTADDFARFYFAGAPCAADVPPLKAAPEHSQSMVYAPFRPNQPMSREEMIDNAYAGIFQVGMDHGFTFLTCNAGYRRMLGYTAKEMAERFQNQALSFVHPEDMDYVNEEIRRQLSLGDTVTIEFRVVKSDGTPIWILGTGNVVRSRHGGVSLIVVIIDNDALKKKNLEMERRCERCERFLEGGEKNLPQPAFDAEWHTGAQEDAAKRSLPLSARYQAAMAQWGDILFEYTFQSGALLYSDNFHSIFGRACRTNIEKELPFVHEEDQVRIREALKIVRAGSQPQPVEIRIRTKGGGFHWYCVMFTQPEQLGGVPVSAIGKISDIDAEKRERDKLLLQFRCDSMTGLLNKGTIEQEIRKLLLAAQPGERYALLLIDMDDFKKMNDSLGHTNGDRVLCEIAARMQSALSGAELIGRAGGDEFLAFLSFAGDCGEVLALAERLLTQLRENITIGQKAYQVSVSMGIACYPENGTHFYDLLCRADSALSRAKELGKNSCCLAAN